MSSFPMTTQEGKEDLLDYLTKEDITTVKYLAIHPSVTYNGVEYDKFSITHLPSGMTIFGKFLKRGNAIKVARAIIKDIPELEKITCQDNLTDDIRKKYKTIKKNIQSILQE